MGALTRDYPAEYQYLAASLGIDKGLNFTPKWSAGADFLELLIRELISTAPRTVIECSSGLSTLVLARYFQRIGAGQVFSLENGREYAENTRHALQVYGLESYAQVIDAPLVDLSLDGDRFQWYDTAGLPQAQAQMLVVDGPPGFIQAHSRYPALPVLRSYLDDRATVLLDDAGRADEQALSRRWLAQCPGACFSYTATERGCAILRLQD